MKRIALARTLGTIAAAVALVTFTAAPAEADHGHNCVWTGGGWVGQGLCPGMPGFEWHGPEPTATPTAEPSPTTTQAPTTPPVTPSPTSTAPSPTSTAPAPTATTPAPTSTSTPQPTSTPTTVCVWSSGQWLGVNCPGQPTFPAATPSTSTTTPAPVATGPLVETDIVLYAPEVNPARILRR